MPGLLLKQEARSCLVTPLPGESGKSWENPFGFRSVPKLVPKHLQLLCQCRWNINKYKSKSRSLILLIRLGLYIHRLLMCVGTTGQRSSFVHLTFWSEGFKWSSTQRLSFDLQKLWGKTSSGCFSGLVGERLPRGSITSNYLEDLHHPPDWGPWKRPGQPAGPQSSKDIFILALEQLRFFVENLK